MIVREDGSVSWAHMSEDSSDNATLGEILGALRRPG
jgi:hypothetical protein